MIRNLLIIAILAWAGDGTNGGREGNRAYRAGEYERASEAYQRALESEDASPSTRFALRHNLGASLYRLGRPDEAREHFQAAAAEATSPSERALAAYNAGNAALASSDFAAAADHFRSALLENPHDPDARFNYEYARRQIPPESQSQQSMMQNEGSGDGQGEPSSSDDADEGEEGGDAQAEPQTGEQPEENGEPQSGEEGEQRPSDRQDTGGRPSERLTREQAEQILGALEQGEERLLREIQRAPYRARNVEKDW